MNKDYIKSIREKIGNDPVILVFAGGVLTNDKGEILLQKRSDFNTWGLPGGALEFGESAVDACKREFYEETGLTVSIEGLLGVTTKQIQKYPNNDVAQSVVIEFVVKKDFGSLDGKSKETLGLEYFGINNLPEIVNEQHLNTINKFFSREYPYYD